METIKRNELEEVIVKVVPDPNYIFVSCTECKYRFTCDHRPPCRIRVELNEPEVQPYVRQVVIKKKDDPSKITMTEEEARKYLDIKLSDMIMSSNICLDDDDEE